MKTNLTLIAALFLSFSQLSGQTLFSGRQNLIAATVSPVAMVELIERQLTDQFKAAATSGAKPTTARMTKNGQLMAYGTIINGRDDRYSYLICPADAVKTSGFVIQTQDGRLHRSIPGVPIQLLSRADNLAIVRVRHLENVVSIKSNLETSSIGSFVGILSDNKTWKTGAVTNSTRSAFNDIDPGTRKALTRHWARIGLKVNEKRSGYPEVIETDLDLDPGEAGSPVFDRSGNWHGIAIARADQHSTLVIPAKRIANLVAEFEFSQHR